MTTVVNIRSEKYDVYIGRAGKGQDGYFGNPHTVYNPLKPWTVCPICKVKHERGEALAAFKKDFDIRIKNDIKYQDRVLGLRGKKLGCFCAPEACHGQVYVDWLEEQSKGSCPQWLQDRMERLRRQPPPTMEQVEAQMRGSIAQREKMRWTGTYDDVDYIK